MQFKIEKGDFIKVLQRMQGIVERRNTMPILSNILLDADQSTGKVNIMATDLEIFIKDSCSAMVKKDGSITVNARKFFEIAKELPEETISVSASDGERVTIKSGKARFNIVGLPAKEFPAFPAVKEEKLARFEPQRLKEMVDKTSFAVSTDETRYNINGFLLEREGNLIRMVTTDGHRLAKIEKEAEGIPGEKEGVILPRKGVTELRRLLEEKEETFSLGITKKNATMKKDSTVINIRLIEGEFPDYKQVVPKDNDKEAFAKRETLLGSLKRVSLLSSDKIKGVKFGLEKGKLILSSSSPEMGDATEELEVDYEGPSLEIAFNARYFIDVLEALEEEEVQIILKDQLSPCILRPRGSGDYTYVVMPMRL
jgi:DNA polymerase-3 subunit beta